jgi:DNA gyrase subunit A
MDNKNIDTRIKLVEITSEMKKSYLDYSMSVIVARALPDVRDGLKPVHRRILYTMYKMGLTPAAKFTKAAKIVGETMGKFHPHGDIPIYDALVRLAQDFSMRYPLVKGQGNFGSVDGDPPAAMRYTEAKLAKISLEALADIDKNTAEFIDNFDGTLQEPVYLPSKIPNLLLMGSDGIAVGMATKIPPHNLGETIDAILLMIKKGNIILPQADSFEIKKISLDDERLALIGDFAKKALSASFESDVSIDDLLQHIKGPDFPTGASIYDKEEIDLAYSTGRGKVLIHGIAEIQETKAGRQQIVITEIPFQVNKSALVAKIARLIKDRKIVGVSDLRDESDRKGMRIVLDLKKAARANAILNSLYEYTPLQTSYPMNMVALVDGVPQTLNLKQILEEFMRHRQKVVTRRTIFDLETAKARAHILEGLKIALDNLDAVIETIKRSADADQARERLMKKFNLTQIQAEAILEMQLRRLAALERKKIEDEYKEVGKLIEYLTGLLIKPEKILEVIKQELKETQKQYGDPRRTKVFARKLKELSESDLVPSEECLITVTKTGYLKRLPIGTYRTQHRGGKGVTGMTTKEEDEIAQLITANTHDNILFFTNTGRVYSIRAWEINEGVRQSKGHAVVNLIDIGQNEEVQSILSLPANFRESKSKYLLMATHHGVIKKTNLREFDNIRSSGKIAIRLKKDDQLCWVKPTTGEDYILLVTKNGKSIRFKESDVRPMGRNTAGVKGIHLKEGDSVVSMEVFHQKAKKPKDRRLKFFRDILVVTENGLGKRTEIKYFPIQKRGGIGVKAANLTDKTGKIVACELVTQRIKQIIITSRKAQVIKLPLKNIPRLGRNTQGVILMRFSKQEDKVAAVTCLED